MKPFLFETIQRNARHHVSGGASHHPPGFTRVELLVIIATLGMLAGLLLPSLARDQDRDSRTVCIHRLNQLARAMAMYASESDDWLPPNPDDGNTTPYFNWCGGQAGRGGGQEFNPDILTDPKRALLTSYFRGDTSVYKCPADRRTGRYQGAIPERMGSIVPSVRTVAMNGSVGTNPYRQGKVPVDGPWLDGNHSHTANQTWYCFGKMGDFVRPGPDKTITFIEEDDFSVNDGAFAIVGPGTPQNYQMFDWPGTYHDMAGGVSFADGHVEMHRWTDSRTKLMPPMFTPANRRQEGSLDIIWLAEHGSAKIVKTGQ